MSGQGTGKNCSKCGGWIPPIGINYCYGGQICRCGDAIDSLATAMGQEVKELKQKVIALEYLLHENSLRTYDGMFQENVRLKKALKRALASAGERAPVRQDVEKILDGLDAIDASRDAEGK